MPVLDTAYLLQLAEYCGTSSAVSKQASKALRAEFAHGAPQAQERAIRVLVSSPAHAGVPWSRSMCVGLH